MLTETLTGAEGGIDTVISVVDFDLQLSRQLHGEFENLTLGDISFGAGPSPKRAFGNAFDNLITGNGQDNILNGRVGADHMIGKAGNDTYYVDNAGDVVQEIDWRNDGHEVVRSTVDFDLGDSVHSIGYIEDLILLGDAGRATGNNLANRLTGNAGNNVIDGKGGADIMVGLNGDDDYIVDAIGDRVVERDGGGLDEISSSVTFNLNGQFAENLALTGSAAVNGFGNQLGNVIIGNDAANILRGGLGLDTLTGNGGRDYFDFNAEPSSANVDTITDFTVAIDRIRLDDSNFTAMTRGRVLAETFVANHTGSAENGDHRLIYNIDSGQLFYDADANGVGVAVQFAQLSANLALTENDFFVI